MMTERDDAMNAGYDAYAKSLDEEDRMIARSRRERRNARIRAGIEAAERGETHDLGSFAAYRDQGSPTREDVVNAALAAYRDIILREAAPAVLEDDDLTITGRIIDVFRTLNVTPEGAWDGAVAYILTGEDGGEKSWDPDIKE